MTDINPRGFKDAWVNPSKPSMQSGSTEGLRIQSGGYNVFVRGAIPAALFGRTVLSATLRAHFKGSGPAQAFTLSRVTKRWAEGRVTSSNQPTVTTSGQVTTTTGALSDGAVISWDVKDMTQLFADGTDFYGWRVTTNAATRQRLYSAEAGEPSWEWDIVVSDAPDVPSNLRPDGGAVSTGKPILAWDFVDLGGDSTEQAKSRIQVDTPAVGVEPDAVAPDYDSGWQTNVEPTWNLAATTYAGAAAAPTTYWRSNVQDGEGNESGWSDWADFTVSAKPGLIVDSPVGAFGDPTPRILAHLSSGTVAAWSIIVTGPDRSDIRAHSGRQTGAVDWTVPFRDKDGRRVLREGKPGWARIRIWDAVARVPAVGDPAYIETWVPLVLDEDLLLAPPGNLSVTQMGDGDPRRVWSWYRTESADKAWLIEVGGHTAARLDPEDVTVSGGTYTWTDSGIVSPLRLQQVGVRALDAGVKSRAATQNVSSVVKGVWLIPVDGEDEPVQLAGGDVASWTSTDAYATYETLRGRQHDVFYGWKPRSGTFEGVVDARNDVWATISTLENYAVNHNRLFRLVWGSRSILVRLRDIDTTPSTEILPNTLEHIVRFGFVEWGE